MKADKEDRPRQGDLVRARLFDAKGDELKWDTGILLEQIKEQTAKSYVHILAVDKFGRPAIRYAYVPEIEVLQRYRRKK